MEPSSLTTFTVNCQGLGAGFASTSQSKVSSMAAPSARALTTSGYNPHSIEKSPLTDADRPPGSVAVSVTVTTCGFANDEVRDFQPSASAIRNSMSAFSPLDSMTAGRTSRSCTSSVRPWVTATE